MSFVKIKEFSVYIIKISCTLPSVLMSLYVLCPTWNLNCIHGLVEDQGAPRIDRFLIKKGKKTDKQKSEEEEIEWLWQNNGHRMGYQ